MVVSIRRLKSSSLRLAFAVSKSKNVSNGENFSSSFCRPEIRIRCQQLIVFNAVKMKNKIAFDDDFIGLY